MIQFLIIQAKSLAPVFLSYQDYRRWQRTWRGLNYTMGQHSLICLSTSACCDGAIFLERLWFDAAELVSMRCRVNPVLPRSWSTAENASKVLYQQLRNSTVLLQRQLYYTGTKLLQVGRDFLFDINYNIIIIIIIIIHSYLSPCYSVHF